MPLSLAAATLTAVLTADARGPVSGQGCEVVLQPDEADPRWQEAIRELRTRLRQAAAGDVDCGGIMVRSDGPERLVVFTTRDGRRAERRVTAAGSLLAVVEALQTTLPEPAAQSVDSPAPDSAKPAAADQPVRAAAHPPVAAEAAKARFLIEGIGGVRVPGPALCSRLPSARTCIFSAVSLGAGVGINVGHWELGVLGQFEPTPAMLTGAFESGVSMSTYALGLRAGRRDPLGPVDVVAGATASIAATFMSANANGDNMMTGGTSAGMTGTGSTGQPTTVAQPRVGVFVGVIVPRRSRLRLRPELAFDFNPTRIGMDDFDRNDPTLPKLSWWSTSASLGVEWEAP
jgi:hypothetical protein